MSRTRGSVSRSTAELLAVAATGALHLAWPDAWSRMFLVVPLVAGWGAYVVRAARKDPTVLHRWGLRREGLGPTTVATTALVVCAGAALFAWGEWTGARYTAGFWLALALYPLWGLIQQLLVQGVVTAGLDGLPIPGARAVAVIGSALAFGVVHVREPVLVVATFVLGLVFAPIWLRWRNLWPLGVAHGWLGALVYFAVLHRDPLQGYFPGL